MRRIQTHQQHVQLGGSRKTCGRQQRSNPESETNNRGAHGQIARNIQSKSPDRSTMGSTLEREEQHMEGIKACRHGRRKGSLESISSKTSSVFPFVYFR